MDNSYCCVPQCNSRGSQVPRTSFHRFPSSVGRDRMRRLQWIAKLRIGKEVSPRMVVCGKHFKKSDFFPAPFDANGFKRRNVILKKNAIPSCNLPTSSKCADETKGLVKTKKKIPASNKLTPEKKKFPVDEKHSNESIEDEEVENTSSSNFGDEKQEHTIASPYIAKLIITAPSDSNIDTDTTEHTSETPEKNTQNCIAPLLPVKDKENSEMDYSSFNASPDDSKEILAQKLETMVSVNALLQKQIKFYKSKCKMYEKEITIMKGVIDNLKQINSVTFDS